MERLQNFIGHFGMTPTFQIIYAVTFGGLYLHLF